MADIIVDTVSPVYTEQRTFKAGELWKKNGAVIMAVRRPGCFLCREVIAGLRN